ncbi:MAG: DNA-directed RNA polymerase subunit delta [bacterium]|nr:DNA-directed RNA polymerase subunit delta [bacterium]
MKLKNMKKEELEVLSYADLTEKILEENKKSMKTADIFKIICDLLELSDSDYSNKIGDYYTSLTTDKRFILLENSNWDLKDKHKVQIDLDEDDSDEYEEEYEEELDSDNETESDNIDDMDESIDITDDEVDLDDTDDDMEDLNIVDDDELDRDDI